MIKITLTRKCYFCAKEETSEWHFMYNLTSCVMPQTVHDKDIVLGRIACTKCASELHEIIEKYRVGKITGGQKND